MIGWHKRSNSNITENNNNLIKRAEDEAKQAQAALTRQKIILKELREEYFDRQTIQRGVE